MLRLIPVALQSNTWHNKTKQGLDWTISLRQLNVKRPVKRQLQVENVYLCIHMSLMLCPNSQEYCLYAQIFI